MAAISLVLVALVGFWSSSASVAEAAFEQVGCFAGSFPGPTAACKPVAEEQFGEEVQLGGASNVAGLGGIAVNYTGNGGVPAGTVYAALGETPNQVAMYEPTPDGGLKFVMRWEASTSEDPYRQCGPPGELPSGVTEHPACAARVGGIQANVDVAVEQATGNVYVQLSSVNSGEDAIVEYTPTASSVITRFGEVAEFGARTADTPGQIHAVQFPGGIAVNAVGDVYVSDSNNFDSFYHRLMKFEPKSPGDFTEYKYAGSAQDVAAGFVGSGEAPREPVVDALGNIYVVGEEQTIERYDPTNPGAPPDCKFVYQPGNVKGMTVDPATGTVYFFSPTPAPRVHQLSACNDQTGQFTEVSQIEVAPERADLWAMTFDPLRRFSADRPEGMLLAGAPGASSDNGGGQGESDQSSLGYIFAPAPESPPEVVSESVANVGTSSAELRAQVNPKGFDTTYVFQYVAAAAFEAEGETFSEFAEAPLGGGAAGHAKANTLVSVALAGLEPNTDYRYRIVVHSNCSPGEPEKVCEVPGAPQTFHTYSEGVAGSSDHRVYELVSPAEKHGGQVFPLNPRIKTCASECKPGLGLGRFPMQSSPDGEAVAFEGYPFGLGVGSPNENQYVARRTDDGWQSVNPTPSLLLSRGAEGYKAFDQALSEAVIGQPAPSLSVDAPAGYINLYFQSIADPFELHPLISQQPHRPPTGSAEVAFSVAYAGASRDLSRVFFAANDAFTGKTPVAPEAENGGGGKYNLYEWERATGTLRLVNVMPDNSATEAGAAFGAASANAISTDGNRAFWSDETGQVYVRESAEKTIEIPDTGKFLVAATNGARVLLADGHLYDLETEDTSDLTSGKGGFQGIVGQSDDLSHIYFVDTEVLSGEEENSEGRKAQGGGFNLYSWREGTTRFVATLLKGDNDPSRSEGAGIRRDWASVPTERTAKASPQGRYLAFVSAAPLTGYDNIGQASSRCGMASAPCGEVFLYDSQDDTLTCPSCNSSGAVPLGWAQLPTIEGPKTLSQPNSLTDSGRLYFDTGDSLTQFDSNQGAQDVYQWERNGVGTCEAVPGCLSLISGGREGQDSNFMAADPSGKNVFFTTRTQLVPTDRDELIDLYDAREFGGFASESQASSTECQGEACQPASAAPGEQPPASSAVVGSGATLKSAKRCRRGQVKKKGKCVKKRRHAKHSKSRNHGGAK